MRFGEIEDGVARLRFGEIEDVLLAAAPGFAA